MWFLKLLISCLVTFVLIHMASVFLVMIMPKMVVFIIYFILFTVATVLLRRVFFDYKLTQKQKIDGTIYFEIITFPLCLYQLMITVKAITPDMITTAHWALYSVMVIFGVVNLRAGLVSRLFVKRQ